MVTLLNTVRDLDRLRQIATVLARHGFDELVRRTGLGGLAPRKPSNEASEKRRGERIRLVMEELGPTFIKLGQLISTRADIIPADIVVELKRLQDDVPAVPFEELRVELENQLGAPTSELYAELEETPLASASIGQVHRAKLRLADGELADVVVKIQRPRIRQIIERDMDLLYWLAHAVERSIPEASAYSPVKLVAEFDQAISAELDFALEADNAERFAHHFEGNPDIVFPKVYRDLSSGTAITLSYLDGDKVLDAVARGHSGERLARQAIGIVIKMIFEHGFFHADPHPGNILILGPPERPVIGLIDLGLVGRLSPKLRDRMIDLLVAIVREDHRAMADAVFAIGSPTKAVDRAALEGEIARLCDKYLGKKLGDIQFSGLIRDLVSGAIRYGLEIPPEFVMVGKSLMTIEGIGKQIYPELDLREEMRPHAMELLGYRYSPEKVTGDLLHLGSRLASAASDLPLQLEEILDDLRRGRLRLEVRDPNRIPASDRLGRRVFAGLVVGSMLLAGALLLAQDERLLGGALMAVGTVWGVTHSVVAAFSARRRNE